MKKRRIKDRRIHILYTGVDMGCRWWRSACGRWNDPRMTGILGGGAEVTCKNCLKTKR